MYTRFVIDAGLPSLKTLINDTLACDFVYIHVVPQFGKLYNLIFTTALTPPSSLTAPPASDTRQKGFSAQLACPRFNFESSSSPSHAQ
ncbi:hypothetical protein SCLCIDRAFT_29459 [Scleroderma citrinum Foug A]|uniref:Uncharacterized protein n=1 Tax=Scleroderma citrinum Foug A TaxID=1036808 RepID=A0A0C2Z3Z2_9AGAM|nr:hypothetical protein SCLCIDRAFT_29459 [Scleroderma citrinum Foug A]